MIPPEFIIRLKNKDYPLWAGILAAATDSGLRSLKTTVLQVPHPDNGMLAVVMAAAIFEDGREFSDVGDCSPASTSPQLAAASLRLASTRAKGRCLRDALNIGQTMYEELPDEEKNGGFRPVESVPVESAPATNGNGNGHAAHCSRCSAVLTAAQATLSENRWAALLCPLHQREAQAQR